MAKNATSCTLLSVWMEVMPVVVTIRKPFMYLCQAIQLMLCQWSQQSLRMKPTWSWTLPALCSLTSRMLGAHHKVTLNRFTVQTIKKLIMERDFSVFFSNKCIFLMAVTGLCVSMSLCCDLCVNISVVSFEDYNIAVTGLCICCDWCESTLHIIIILVHYSLVAMIISYWLDWTIIGLISVLHLKSNHFFAWITLISVLNSQNFLQHILNVSKILVTVVNQWFSTGLYAYWTNLALHYNNSIIVINFPRLWLCVHIKMEFISL